MRSLRHLAMFAALTLFALPLVAQTQPIPTPAGAERVVFRTALAPTEIQFLETTPALLRYRRDLRDALRQGQLYWGEIDLDGDGRPEILLIDERSDFCGTAGCGALVLTGPRGRWRVIGTITAEHYYFVAFAERDYGWRRLESTGSSGLFWTGCRYYGGGNERELAEWPPDPCPRIHYGEGLLAKEKKRAEK